MADNKQTGDYIKKVRTEAGLSQSQLAQLLNVSREAVSKWENGHHMPDIAVLENLAEVLGVTVDTLLRGQKDSIGVDVSSTASPGINNRRRKKLLATIAIIAVLSCAFVGVLLSRHYTSFDSDYMKIWTEKVYRQDGITQSGNIYLLSFDNEHIKWMDLDKRYLTLENVQGNVMAISMSIRTGSLLIGSRDREDFHILEYLPLSEGDGYSYILYYPGPLSDLPKTIDEAFLQDLAAKEGSTVIDLR